MNKAKRIFGFLLQLALLATLLLIVVLAVRTIVPVQDTGASVQKQGEQTTPISDSGYPPPSELPTTLEPNYDAEPFIIETVEYPVWTPQPTPTLKPGPKPTPIPLIELAKNAEGTIYYFTMDEVDHHKSFASLQVDARAAITNETKVNLDDKDTTSDDNMYHSPDGSKIAIVGPWGVGGIYSIDAGVFEPFFINAPKFLNWFPDNIRVLMGGGGLTLKDPVTGEFNRLAGYATGTINGAAASPDGQSIIYSYTKFNSPSSIWMVNPDGRDAHWLFDVPSSDAWNFTWSPDGKMISFWSGGLMIMNADGSNLRQMDLGAGPAQCYSVPPVWSPDSRFLAFVTSMTASFCDGWGLDNFNRSNIFIVDIENSKGYPLLADGSEGNIDPAWSPDGQQIAFLSIRSGKPEVWLVNRDGSDLRMLTQNGEMKRYPVWRKP